MRWAAMMKSTFEIDTNIKISTTAKEQNIPPIPKPLLCRALCVRVKIYFFRVLEK